MPFTDNDVRASHTIRIFGTNKAGDVLQDIWLDLERIDVFRVTTKSPTGQFQGMYRRLHWLDDPEANDYNPDGNPARTVGTLKICSPDEEDQEDPEEWVPVRTIIEMAWNESTDVNRLGVRRGNRTSADNQVRTVEARRCFHRDTIIDDEVDAATTADPTLNAYVVSSDRYDFVDADDPAKQDKDDYIEVQYVSYTFDQSSRKEDEGKHQGVQFSLKNSHYLRITDEAKGPNNPVHGFDPPWALDPFQAIVNVQFTPTVIVVFFNPGGSFQIPDDLKDKGVKDLGPVSITEDSGFNELHAFKVNAGLDQVFVTSTSQNFALPSVTVFVCPMTGDDDTSLDDALHAVRAFFPAAVSGEPLPVPEGILWMATLGAGPPSAKIDWKVAHTKHRLPEPPGTTSTVKNVMTQVYPLSIIPNTFVVTGPPDFTDSYFGFNIVGYRLDKKATGQLYDGGNSRGSVNILGSPPSAWTSDVILTSTAGGTGNFGVKFPTEEFPDLPLIAADVPA